MLKKKNHLCHVSPAYPGPLFVEDFVQSYKPRSLRSLMKEWLCAAALFGILASIVWCMLVNLLRRKHGLETTTHAFTSLPHTDAIGNVRSITYVGGVPRPPELRLRPGEMECSPRPMREMSQTSTFSRTLDQWEARRLRR